MADDVTLQAQDKLDTSAAVCRTRVTVERVRDRLGGTILGSVSRR